MSMDANAGLRQDAPAQLALLRRHLRENFGKIVMALMTTPRYRSQMLPDLQHLVLEPMLHDRIAIALPGPRDAETEAGGLDIAGFAIWASVSEEVDARIREQIGNGVFPVRLKPQDWRSGKINWLLDVIAQDRAKAAAVIANFGQVAPQGELRLHPLISQLVEPEALSSLGVRRAENAGPAAR